MLNRPSVQHLKELEDAAPKPDLSTRVSTTVAAIKRAISKFSSEKGTDIAATLTYYAVLSMFPALIALVSTLGIFGQGQETVDEIMSMMEEGVPPETMAFLEGPLEGLVTSQAAGFGLIFGILGALWTASGYVGAFGRALNRLYGVREGRPFLIVKPVHYLVTAVLLICVAAALFMLTISGSFAQTLFDLVGIGDTGLVLWNYGKWPLILLVLILVVSLLYQLTPNVKQMKFRFLSVGGAFALLILGLSILGFSFYVSNFGSYDATYGSLAGIIMMLLLIWIANIALLIGALVDSELERGRMLAAGIRAERYIQLPLRSESGVIKFLEKREKLVEEAADIRRSATAEMARTDNGVERPEGS